MEISKTDTSLLYNSRILDTYIKLIKKNYSYINLSELLSYAGIAPHEVADEGHWFTQKQVNLFYERLENLTRNRGIAREAGRYAASSDALGAMRPYILGLVGPAKAYEIVGKYAPNFTKSSIYESKAITAHKIGITVTPKKGISEKPFQCENRIGYFEAIALMFNYRLPEIEHPECIFKGGNACRYIISWRESRFAFWGNIRNYTALLLSAACIGSYFIYPWTALIAISSFSVFAILALSLYVKAMETMELNTAIDNIRGSTDKLLEQIDMNYNNSLMINEVGLSLSKQMDIDSILSNVMQVLEKRLYYDRGMILLANQERSMLSFRIGFGYTAEQLNMLKNASFHLDRPDSKGVFVVSFREQKPFLINNINEIESSLSPHSLEFAKKLGVKSFVCCPIIYEEDSLGILAVDNINTKKPLIQSDISLLSGVAPEIGISIHNSMLFEAKQRQFQSILLTLAASIDARDSLTAGHSEKVTEYALGICHELGLSKDYCEMIRVAALLHDYGKIGIKDSILMKPGKLDIEERKEIETHSGKTKEILEQIHFEGIYKEIPAIAGSHHEKINGSGYPNGLKAEEIPLGAKIIAVADFFEAITSKRHYRDPMPLDIAFQLLKEETGKSFDRKVVEAFISYYGKKNNEKLDQSGL
ncbi:MAG: HD-GYP domain-containing protein [Planctomycetota bacterium]|nr:HD-GYP domain-containing protein [Planctomycetota bacterium]